MAFLKQWMCIAVLLSGPTCLAEQSALTQELNSYVGQKLILRSYGDLQEVSVKRKELNRSTGTCDRVVEVLGATLKKNRIVFRLEHLGDIRNGGASRCHLVWFETTFAITDVGDISPKDLVSELQAVFLTPEGYLARNGQSLIIEPTEEIGPIAVPGRDATFPRPLFEVTPNYTEARKMRVSSSRVRVKALIGMDGRIHSAQIINDPGYGLGEQTLRILPFWRFEPARRDGKPIACQFEFEFAYTRY